jgi:hypothetical protein
MWLLPHPSLLAFVCPNFSYRGTWKVETSTEAQCEIRCRISCRIFEIQTDVNFTSCRAELLNSELYCQPLTAKRKRDGLHITVRAGDGDLPATPRQAAAKDTNCNIVETTNTTATRDESHFRGDLAEK